MPETHSIGPEDQRVFWAFPSMPTVKIAHIADIHLRDRQYSFASRGEDFYKGLRTAIETAVNENVSAILCSGDLFDTARPSSSTVGTRLSEIDNLLKQANIPMLTISGNHDANCWEWLSLFKNRGEHSSGLICIDNDSYTVGGIKITGIPYCHADELRDYFSEHDLSDTQVLMWHGNVKELCGFPIEDSISLEEFPVGIQLVAMGHIHEWGTEIRAKDKMVVVYPGSTELCSQDEDPVKRICVHKFINNRLCESRAVSFKTRPVQTFILKTELDVENCLTKIDQNALVFVGYDRNLTNAIPRLNTILGPNNILRPTILPDDGSKVNFDADAEPLEGPVKYVEAHIAEVVAPDVAERIKDLATACVDVTADHKNAIDEYCEKRLGGRVTL